MRRLLGLLGAVVLLVSLAPASQATAATATQWQRFNPGISSAPEHERLTCVSSRVVLCVYDKVPAPTLDFGWDRTKGVFLGTDATETWQCPVWLPSRVCDARMRVTAGRATYFPQGAAPFSVGTDLIVLDFDGARVLLFYWRDQFACPWFPTFAQALAANPIPLPYDGVHGGVMDCFFAS